MADTQASLGYGITFEMADVATPTSFDYISEIFDLTPPSDSTEQVQATHMQSPNRTHEFIEGLTDPGEVSFEMNYVPGSDSDKKLTAAKGKRKRCRITFPNGVQVLFTGSRQTYEKTAPTEDKMTASVAFKVSGEPLLTDPTAPRNLVAASIVGTAKVGVPLEADTGVWAGATTFAYQWKVDGTNKAGATSRSYVPVTGDLGKPVTVVVTGDNGSFTLAVTTAATANVIA